MVRQQISSTSGTVLGGFEYDYDIRNNVTRFVLNMGGYEVTQRYLYEAISGQSETERYAKDNLPIRYLISDSRYADYDYDSLNRLTQRSFSTTRPLLNNYSYYASERNTGNSTYYQTTKLHTEIIDNVAYRYTYDDAGNIIKIEKGTRVSGTNTASNFTDYFSYEYDLLGQLTRVNSVPENTTTLYFYDNCGNILDEVIYAYSLEPTQWLDSEVTPISRIDYGYNGFSTGFYNLLARRTVYTYDTNGVETETDSKTFFYDEMGNPIDYGNIELWWEDGRRLSSILIDNQDLNVFYTYDSDGLRTSKTVNGAKSEYLYLNGLLSEEIRDGHCIHYSYDSYGHLSAIQYYLTATEFALYYVTTNAQGDVLGLYDGDGDLIASYEYDAWGNVISMTDLTEFGIATINPIRYRGYYFDEETGWYYLQSRYYDPVLGRCITPDSTDVLLASPMSLTDKNLYAYCDNNPVVRADHGGNFWHIAAGAAIGGLFELGAQLLSGENVNWAKVGIAALAGGVTAAVGPLAGAAISGVTNIALDAMSGEKDVKKLLVSGAIGAGASLVGSGIGKVVEKVGGKLATKVLSKMPKATLKATVTNLVPSIKGAERNAIKSISYLTSNYPTIGTKYFMSSHLGRTLTTSIGQIAEGFLGSGANGVRRRYFPSW